MAASVLAPPVGRRLPWIRRSERSDAQLVAGVRGGDGAAFSEIFDRHSAALLSFCRHMLGSREDAEDALQQVFVSAHLAMLRNEDELNLKPWLFAIARNRCLSMLRRRRDEVLLDDAERLPSPDGLAAEVQQREDLRELLGDMQRLPEDQRAALILAEIGAHTHEEIGEVLEVEPRKVKALVFQARESLAAQRSARATPCGEVREQLASLRGSALRRAPLRRHVSTCEGCQDFQAEVARQRAAFALLLPVVPTAGLKSGVLSAVGASGVIAGGTTAAAGTVAGGGVLAAAGSGVATKAVIAVVAVGGVGGGGYVANHELRSGGLHRQAAPVAGNAAGQASARSNGAAKRPTQASAVVAARARTTIGPTAAPVKNVATTAAATSAASAASAANVTTTAARPANVRAAAPAVPTTAAPAPSSTPVNVKVKVKKLKAAKPVKVKKVKAAKPVAIEPATPIEPAKVKEPKAGKDKGEKD